MIIVTGTTGTLGSLIVRKLLKKISASEMVAVSRDPSKASALSDAGVVVRYGDFDKPDSLVPAFMGASQVLIVSSNAEAYGGDTLGQHRIAIDAARDAGARRIVYTSHMGASPSSAFSPMRNHAATEAMLLEAGVPWTALRNGFYASTVQQLVGDAASTGLLVAPADGKVSWTTHEDLAEAAATILVDEGRFDGPTPALTASEALDLSEVVAVLARLTGKHIERKVMTDDEQVSKMTAYKMPAAVAEMTLGLYRAARAGEFAATDPTLEALLGYQPTGVRDYLKQSLMT